MRAKPHGNDTLEALALGERPSGRPLADGEWGAVLARAPDLTLLLPRGAGLGLSARAVAADAPGLTLRALLAAIHAHYAVRRLHGWRSRPSRAPRQRDGA